MIYAQRLRVRLLAALCLAGLSRQLTSYDTLKASLGLCDLLGITGATRCAKGVDGLEEVGLKGIVILFPIVCGFVKGRVETRLPQQSLQLLCELFVALAHGAP